MRGGHKERRNKETTSQDSRENKKTRGQEPRKENREWRRGNKEK